jgi:hypothetical protein
MPKETNVETNHSVFAIYEWARMAAASTFQSG